jgi:glutathione S-transferase
VQKIGTLPSQSGAILLYLAEKFGAFLPKDRGKRTEALNWLFCETKTQDKVAARG